MTNDARWIIAIAALLVLDATAFGAFGSHVLKARLTPERFEVFETAILYQFFHSLGLLAIGLAAARRAVRGLRVSAWLVGLGILVFSGSLVAITFGAPRWFGAITPVGGLLLMAGWLFFALTVFFAMPGQSVPAEKVSH